MENREQRTFWNASAWLVRQEVPMAPEDEMLYNSVQKIKELEEIIKAKDKEIKDVRKQTYEELEPMVMVDRVRAGMYILPPPSVKNKQIKLLSHF